MKEIKDVLNILGINTNKYIRDSHFSRKDGNANLHPTIGVPWIC